MGLTVMRNRYKSICFRCGEAVQAEHGLVSFESFPGLRWKQMGQIKSVTLVEHDACRIKYAGTDVHHVFNPDREDDVEVIERD